jgi:hypothetical protein
MPLGAKTLPVAHELADAIRRFTTGRAINLVVEANIVFLRNADDVLRITTENPVGLECSTFHATALRSRQLRHSRHDGGRDNDGRDRTVVRA